MTDRYCNEQPDTMDLGALTAQAWAVAVSTLISAKAFCIAYVVPFMCIGLVWKICYELLYAEFVLVREEEQRRVKAPRGIVSPLVLRDTEQALHGAQATQRKDKRGGNVVRKTSDRRLPGASQERGAASGGRPKSKSPERRRYGAPDSAYGQPVDRVAEWAQMSSAAPAPSPDAHGFVSHGPSAWPTGGPQQSANDSSRGAQHGAWHSRPEDGHSQPGAHAARNQRAAPAGAFEHSPGDERSDSQTYEERRREASSRRKMSTESLVGDRSHLIE